ncbi:MAG: hypothetical protein ACRD2T_12200, partial [Thermoanaerobaculia bacterium]
MNLSCIAGLVLSVGAPGEAEEEGGRQPGRLRREEYRGLFPFYSRESFEDGGTRVSAAFNLFRYQSEPDGDGYIHLLPFYYAAREQGGAARSLGIIPFYLRGRSPGSRHDVVFPSLALWEKGDSSHALVWPLFHAAREPEELPFRAIPTLFRRGRSGEEVRDRLGVPVLAELFERSSGPGGSAFTVLNFFNFGKEARHGLPLGKLSLSGDGDYHAHLVPLVFAGRDGDSRYLHTPFYGGWSGGDDRRGWAAPLLLSGRARRGERSDLHAPWPLVHVVESPTESSVRAAPVYFAGERRGGGGEVLSRHRFVIPLWGSTEDLAASRRDLY